MGLDLGGRWMQRSSRTWAAAGIAAAVVLGGAPAQAAVPRATVLAVTGTNSALYVQADGGSTWRNLGGALVGAPAVASWGGVTHYVGTGTNQVLYHRTGTTGWHRLGAGYCTNLSAFAEDGTVFLSCRGGNAALYTAEFDAGLQRPTVTLRNRGGVVIGAVPVTDTDDGPVYYARTPTYVEDGSQYNVAVFNPTYGWERAYRYCTSTPAYASSVVGSYFACQRRPGVIGIATYFPDEGGEYVEDYLEIAGDLTATPALAMTGDDTAELFVQGTNGAVYHRGLTVDGPTRPTWTRIDAAVAGGVAATSLGPPTP